MNHNIIITGAGIVGLATAYKLLKKNPGLKLLILEKENGVAKHQTGNNKGVVSKLSFRACPPNPYRRA